MLELVDGKSCDHIGLLVAGRLKKETVRIDTAGILRIFELEVGGRDPFIHAPGNHRYLHLFCNGRNGKADIGDQGAIDRAEHGLH